MEEAPLTGSDLLQKILLAVGAFAVTAVGAWTAQTLGDLNDRVLVLSEAMIRLTAKVDGLPPRDLMLRIELLEKRQDRISDEIHVLASKHGRNPRVEP